MPNRTARREDRGNRSSSSSRGKTNLPIKALHGRAGGDPEWRQAGDSEVLEFSLAVTTSYDDDAQPLWVQITVWDSKPEMQDWVEKNVEKGSAIAVEGPYKTEEGDTKTFHKISASRIGLIDFFRPPTSGGSRRGRDDDRSSSRGRGRDDDRRRDADDDDELPF